ncbi:helix-turn-helix domain-containing protein [Actinokineospora iranica]|uniref:Helix-turn-helix domain-containing protein n=1 Tax=Actinokineospora iranica TaxID=1271860 RepID=A0A1G6JPE8_9PSEU|nr:helix-turn-helix transcriptional regulator [Actinokineospora iranica]SDC20541.1 Helix-turn-helix domain-containing protein [Actinokineospora iranica]
MNTAGDDPRMIIDPSVWQEPETRAALRVRDIGTVYRQLKRHGVSQRRIAALTGQSQPEVSEIMRGRQVMAYEVLSRIADGLGVPRGLMGLAYDSPRVASCAGPTEGESDVERRGFIGLVAKAAVVGLSGAELDSIRVLHQATPMPGRIGHADVSNLETTVQFFRAQDDQFGGGAVKSAVVGHLEWATGMLESPAADDVRNRLRIALADMHSLAGWVSFDLGAHEQANRHFANALVLAKESKEHALASKVLFQMGRVYLHQKEPENALKIFQLGQMSAQDANSHRAVALNLAVSAWAHAEMGNAEQTKSLLAHASGELSRDNGQDIPTWLNFMGVAEIEGISGMAYTALSGHDRSFADLGIQHASRSFEMRDESDARSRASDLIAIAANNLRAGNVTEGIRAASDVLPRLDSVRSTRLMDRLTWVRQATNLHPSSGEARELAERITELRSA